MPREYWIDRPEWQRAYRIEWAEVVGSRIRRLRRAHDLTLATFAMHVIRPDRSRYSPSYYSRLERGWGVPPLHIYVAIAAVLGVHPGRLLGVDDAERDVNAEEMTLIRVLRRENIAPDEALHRIMSARPSAPGEPDRPDTPLTIMREPPNMELEPRRPPAIEQFKSRDERLRLDWED